MRKHHGTIKRVGKLLLPYLHYLILSLVCCDHSGLYFVCTDFNWGCGRFYCRKGAGRFWENSANTCETCSYHWSDKHGTMADESVQ